MAARRSRARARRTRRRSRSLMPPICRTSRHWQCVLEAVLTDDAAAADLFGLSRRGPSLWKNRSGSTPMQLACACQPRSCGRTTVRPGPPGTPPLATLCGTDVTTTVSSWPIGQGNARGKFTTQPEGRLDAAVSAARRGRASGEPVKTARSPSTGRAPQAARRPAMRAVAFSATMASWVGLDSVVVASSLRSGRQRQTGRPR